MKINGFLASEEVSFENVDRQWMDNGRTTDERRIPSYTISSPMSHNAQRSSPPKPLGQSVKFYVERPWVGGTKVCSRHLGHMTKMAAMPIYGKNPSKIFYRTGGTIATKLGM